jgi:hypothetical protein
MNYPKRKVSIDKLSLVPFSSTKLQSSASHIPTGSCHSSSRFDISYSGESIYAFSLGLDSAVQQSFLYKVDLYKIDTTSEDTSLL